MDKILSRMFERFSRQKLEIEELNRKKKTLRLLKEHFGTWLIENKLIETQERIKKIEEELNNEISIEKIKKELESSIKKIKEELENLEDLRRKGLVGEELKTIKHLIERKKEELEDLIKESEESALIA